MMVQRATRRNISITDSDLDVYLDTKVGKGNVSDFIQEALRYYIDNQVEVKYATVEELEKVKAEVKQVKVILEEMSKVLFK